MQFLALGRPCSSLPPKWHPKSVNLVATSNQKNKKNRKGGFSERKSPLNCKNPSRSKKNIDFFVYFWLKNPKKVPKKWDFLSYFCAPQLLFWFSDWRDLNVRPNLEYFLKSQFYIDLNDKVAPKIQNCINQNTVSATAKTWQNEPNIW